MAGIEKINKNEVYVGGVAHLMAQRYVDVIHHGGIRERWIPRDAAISVCLQGGLSYEEANEVVEFIEIVMRQPDALDYLFYTAYDLINHKPLYVNSLEGTESTVSTGQSKVV